MHDVHVRHTGILQLGFYDVNVRHVGSEGVKVAPICFFRNIPFLQFFNIIISIHACGFLTRYQYVNYDKIMIASD